MTFDTSHDVTRDGNVLIMPMLNSPFVVGNLLRALFQGHEQRGYTDFVLDFSNVQAAFPNVCAPLAGILEFYSSTYGTTFDFVNVPKYLAQTHALSPLIVGAEYSHKTSPLDNVWKFSTSDEIHSLVNAYLDAVSRSVVCEDGVIVGLNWCLYEVMGNVLQHALTTHGYLMGQIHPTSQHIALCVYDHGQGILNSLRHSRYAPRTAVDAITIALQEGVTRDTNVGQGNGLWGLHNIVQANSGFLNITSGAGFFGMRGDEPKTSSKIPFLSKSNNCTTVDFQIDFDKGISVPDALGGYDPTNFRVEDLEDEFDRVVFRLAEKASGTGTRDSGEAIRNEVMNIYKQTDGLIILDFDGVSLVASSFADELVGMLAVKCGFVAFNQRFRLVGMNDTVQAIVNHAVQKRLATGLREDD